MKFIQINTHHTPGAMANLMKLTSKPDTWDENNPESGDENNPKHWEDIVSITEPYLVLGRISGLNGRRVVSYKENPRAAIMLPPHVEAQKRPDFTDRDTATCMIKIDQKWYLITSLYCDGKKDPIPKKLIEILEYANKNEIGLLICADSNSWNMLWGCDYTSDRGMKWDEEIIRYSLPSNK